MQRRCSMDSRQVGFVALSIRVLNTTPGFQDSSNPHESSRTPNDSAAKAGRGVLVISVVEGDDGMSVASGDGVENFIKEGFCTSGANGTGAAMSNLGTIRGAIDFG